MEENLPVFLRERLLKEYKKDIVEKIILGYMQKRKVTLRVNTIKMKEDELENFLINSKINYSKVSFYSSAFILENIREEEIRNWEFYKEGKIYLQSLSSMLPPLVLEPKAKENILDMAAAPGGKTTQISALSENTALITACEKNKIRYERLEYNVNKQGAKGINLMRIDARNLSDFFSFDKILLDAPCSGSGTLNLKNENIEKNFTEELIERSVKLQETLLKKAIKILKVGGELIYSTCSILKEENEDLLERILNKNLELIPIANNIFENVPKLPVKLEGTLCVMPNELYEGFFVAKIRKKN